MNTTHTAAKTVADIDGFLAQGHTKHDIAAILNGLKPMPTNSMNQHTLNTRGIPVIHWDESELWRLNPKAAAEHWAALQC